MGRHFGGKVIVMRWILAIVLASILLAIWIAATVSPDLRVLAWIATPMLGIAILALVLGPVTKPHLKRVAEERQRARKALAEAPERRPEILALRSQLRRTVRAIMTNCARRRRRSAAVGKTPLYLVLGAPSSGRSAVLEQSGLRLARYSTDSDGSNGKWPEWWQSTEAVVVETPGHWICAEHDVEWTVFAKTVRELRPGTPVDGVCVVVDAAALMAADEQAREDLAARLSARLGELMDRLEAIVPVYLLLTKADSLTGFDDFWGLMDRREPLAAWGASLDVDGPSSTGIAEDVKREFDGVLQAAHGLVLDRLASVGRGAGAGARLLQFTLELRALQAPLVKFASTLCRTEARRRPHLIRGFYLTSATADRQPMVPAIAARTAAIELATAGRESRGRGGLVDAVFRDVILPDHGIAGPSEAGLRRRARRDARAGIAVAGITAALLVPAVTSYAHNEGLAGTVAAAGGSFRAQVPAATVPGMPNDAIESMLDALDQVDEDVARVSLWGWFGSLAARELQDPLRQIYGRHLHANLLRLVRPVLEQRLEAIAAAQVLLDAASTQDASTPLSEAYETLKLSVMLSQPAGHADIQWASDHLARLWQEALGLSETVPIERLERHAARYLGLLQHDVSLAWPASGSLRAARDRLKEFDVRGLPYRRLLVCAAGQPPIHASDIFSAASLQFLDSRGDVQVPGAYTAGGWSHIREALGSLHPWPTEVAVEPWVIADSSIPANERARRDSIRDQYFEDYSRHWMAFLDELRVKAPVDFGEIKVELTALAGNGLYESLFGQFKLNAIHDDSSVVLPAAGGLLGRLPWAKTELDAGKGTPLSPVEVSFRPILEFSGGMALGRPSAGQASGLEKYLAILDKLKASLDEQRAHPSAALGTQFSEARTAVAALLDGIEEPVRGRLWRLLTPPVAAGEAMAKLEGVKSLSEDWSSTVWTAWDDKLRGRFPFKRSPAPSVNFADFATFFRADSGILWGFVQKNLSGRVEQLGNGRLVPKRGADPLDANVFSFLNAAREVTEAFFHDGEEPGLAFAMQVDWTAPDVTQARIAVGAKETELAKAQWSGVLRWFGEDVRLEWTQAARPMQELGRHAFSLFDLIAQWGSLRPVGGANRGTYVADRSPLTIKVRSEAKGDVLDSEFFTRLQCPEEIHGAKP